ncbi:hypothetical protein LIER_23715 [Lithospermum erythrorhizon]|uniref:Uncharacterized protein n=1 Tax=Lithospermum erythrorhizon TaxID=34254 RepID=A0AAV3R2G5_LITER
MLAVSSCPTPEDPPVSTGQRGMSVTFVPCSSFGLMVMNPGDGVSSSAAMRISGCWASTMLHNRLGAMGFKTA